MARVAQMLICCQPSRCPSPRRCGGSLFPLQSSASASAAPARHSSIQFSGRTAPPPLAVAGSRTPSTHLFPVTADSPLPRAGGGGGCRRRSPPRKVSAFSSPSKGEQKLVHEGLITESLPNGMFRVLLDNEDLILGYVSGKIRRGFIRILPGDRVRVEISRYDSTKGRIVYRLRNKGAAKEQT